MKQGRKRRICLWIKSKPNGGSANRRLYSGNVKEGRGRPPLYGMWRWKVRFAPHPSRLRRATFPRGGRFRGPYGMQGVGDAALYGGAEEGFLGGRIATPVCGLVRNDIVFWDGASILRVRFRWCVGGVVTPPYGRCGL